MQADRQREDLPGNGSHAERETMEEHSDLVAMEHRAHGRGNRGNAAVQAAQVCTLHHYSVSTSFIRKMKTHE